MLMTSFRFKCFKRLLLSWQDIVSWKIECRQQTPPLLRFHSMLSIPFWAFVAEALDFELDFLLPSFAKFVQKIAENFQPGSEI